MSDDRLPVTILTGFLGSGKTTLLAVLLKREAFHNTAVIVNEFGETGLDHELLRTGDESMALLAGGCVCCTLRSDLADTLKDLFNKRVRGRIPEFDRVIVETTGLADPAPLIHTLIVDPISAARYRLEGVVTTVDAVNARSQLSHHREAVKQVAVADRIVLTKADLAAPETTAAVIERLKAINPAATPILAEHGEVEAAAIIGLAGAENRPPRAAEMEDWLAADAYGRDHDHHHDHGHAHCDDPGHRHHAHDGVTSFTLAYAEPFDWEAVAEALDRIAALGGERLLRLKGLIAVAGRDRPVVAHAVQHLFHPPVLLDRWPSERRDTRLVFITQGLGREEVEPILDAALTSRVLATH